MVAADHCLETSPVGDNGPSGFRIRYIVSMQFSSGGRDPWCTAQILAEQNVKSVLDIGCGPGSQLQRLDGFFTRVVGLDTDRATLEDARRQAPRAELVHQTADDLPFSDNEFDVVVLADVLEHVGLEKQQHIVDEAHRVVKTGGLLVLTVPHTGVTAPLDPMDLKRRLPRVYGVYMRMSGYRPSTEQDIGHQHVSQGALDGFLAGRFVIEKRRFCGFIEPLILWFQLLCTRVFRMNARAAYTITRLRSWEGGVRYPKPLAYNMWITARAI